jgi:hypothetical protein
VNYILLRAGANLVMALADISVDISPFTLTETLY